MKNKVLILIILSAVTISAQKITVQDILGMDRLASFQISPDGQYIVYTKGIKKDWKDKNNFDLWLCSTQKNESFQLTTSEKNDVNPKWSPDLNRIAFLSARNEGMQIYIINPKGGEARQLTDVKEKIIDYEWANDSSIVYLSDEPRDSSIVKKEKENGGAYIVGTESNTSSLWYQTISGEPKRITDGKFYISSFSVTRDAKKIAVIGAVSSDLYQNMSNNFVKILDGNGKELAAINGGRAYQAVEFSPSGEKLAVVGCLVGYSSFDALWVVDVNTGEYKNYTDEFSPTINKIQWINDENISFSTPHNARMGIYELNLKNGNIKSFFQPDQVINSYSFSSNGKMLAFTGSSTTKTPQLYFADISTKQPIVKQITDLNSDINKKIKVTSKIISFAGVGGDSIYTVLTYPPNYDKNKKYPLLVLPHGGPDSYVLDYFSTLSQLLAQEGFIVYEPNFHGSTGFGSKFYESNRGREGDIDYKDILMGLDYLISNGVVDTSKMVVGGWSYGGYMTNWIIGHTNRFKAAVSVAGITNMTSMYAESDINHGDIARWDVNGVPVLNLENFIRTSPLTYLKNCKTPTLILHGTGDDRVPVGQSWQLYWALKDVGVETQMIIFPGAPHSINNDPRYFADVMTNWIKWYDEHLNK